MTTQLLRIDASSRTEGSVTRAMNDHILRRFEAAGPVSVVERQLKDIDFIDDSWIDAAFTPADDRTGEQRERLALSDAMVAELKEADVLLIGLPIYNFSVPAALKAWVDQVARVGETFRYTAEGPRGLLQGKRAIVSVASGGTEVGTDIDYATSYLRHVLGFLGIEDVLFVAADRQAVEGAASVERAHEQIDGLSIAA